MQNILAELRSLDSVNGTNRYGKLMEKLSVGSSDFMVGNQSVLIDLSFWYKDSLSFKIAECNKNFKEYEAGIFKNVKKIQGMLKFFDFLNSKNLLTF